MTRQDIDQGDGELRALHGSTTDPVVRRAHARGVRLRIDGECWVTISGSRASRDAWTEAYGPIPDGLWVLHHCDNAACCRPTHLYLGDAVQNARDREARGRHAHIRPANAKNPPWRETCRKGHVLAETARMMPNGRRRCVVCHREATNRSRARQRAA